MGGKAADTFAVPGTESQAGRDVLERELTTDSGTQAQVVFQAPAGTRIDDAANRARLGRFLSQVRRQPDVEKVDAVTPSPIAPRIGFVFVSYRGGSSELGTGPADHLESASASLRRAGVEVELGGEIQIGDQALGGSSEYIGLGVAVIVLLVAFGSIVAMGLPLGTALMGLGTGIGLITVAERFIDVPTVAPTLATMIGLGVGIDYALFIVTRHREHLHRGMTVEES